MDRLRCTRYCGGPKGADHSLRSCSYTGAARSAEELKRLGPYEQNARVLGPVFAGHGYAFLYLFRRGVGLSRDQGTSAVDLMNAEADRHGQDARNSVQLDLLENREMGDTLAALTFLRALPIVDRGDIGLVGHSFGGSLTLLVAEREPSLRAAVIFSVAGYSWDRSPQLRVRLLAAVPQTKAPVMLIHAANDFSLGPGKALAARLSELGKAHVLKIYPAFGRTPEEGHDILNLAVSTWQADVFTFLDQHMQL